MIGILFALTSLGLTVGNLMIWGNQSIVQIISLVFSLFALVFYSGMRSRSSYDRSGVRIFTLGFAFCFASFMAAGGLLLAYFFHLG